MHYNEEISELFAVSTDSVGLHLKNLYQESELTESAITEDSSVVQKEGNRDVPGFCNFGSVEEAALNRRVIENLLKVKINE